MDPIAAQKLRARKSYKRRSNYFQFVYNLILQLLTALACALLTSYSHWLPSVKRFLFISLPSSSSYILSPRCLFVVVNVIVVTLIGQSKLGRSTMKPSPSCEIYDEYVKRSRSGIRMPPPMSSIVREVGAGKEVHEEKTMVETSVETSEHVEEEGFKRLETECVKEKGEEREEEEEEEELPNEELNRRVEEFIARVNRQMWLEVRSLMNIPTQHVGQSIAVHG